MEQAPDFEAALHELVVRSLTEHQRILFNGNGYDASWLEEAERRGLANLSNSVEAFSAFLSPKNIALFTTHGVFTQGEMQARNEIHFESYSKRIHIEALTMIDMVRRQIQPAVSAYAANLCSAILTREEALPESSCGPERRKAREISRLNDALDTACTKLEEAVAAIPEGDVKRQAAYYYEKILLQMERVRTEADALEVITAADFWPYPTYIDLLFSE